jgi:hypothetical protein
MTEGSASGATGLDEQEERPPLWSARNLALAGAAIVLIIALVSIARYRSGSERRRYDAVMKSSLDHVVTAQEGFYYDSTRYAPALRSLPTVQLPPGVHIQLFNPDRKSWWGLATHDRSPRRRCVVWVGSAPAALPPDGRSPEDETKPLCYDATQLAALTPRHS